MKLKQFKEKDKNKIGILLFTIFSVLLITGVILYKTFAIFEVNQKLNIINGKIENLGDVYFAFYKDGEIQKEMPLNESGYVLDEKRSYCGTLGQKNSDIQISLNEEGEIKIKGVTTTKTKCNLYFTKGIYLLGHGVPTVTDKDGLYEVKHENVNGTILDQEFNQTEYRYAGSMPDNYVEFNGETWRIIGLVNVMVNENKVEQRVKIIKNENIGKYSWDYKQVGNGSSISQWGSNDWTDSELMQMLNDSYFYSTSGDCYQSEITPITCKFDGTDTNTNNAKGINQNAQLFIDDEIIWNIGGLSTLEGNTPDLFYQNERSSSTYKGSNVERPYIWEAKNTKDKTGKVSKELYHSIALMYPSDCGYAVGGTNRQICLEKDLNNYDTDGCSETNWLMSDYENWKWLLTPFSSENYYIFYLYHGKIQGGNGVAVYGKASIYPTLYLKPNVKIIKGFGTEKDPFELIYEVS